MATPGPAFLGDVHPTVRDNLADAQLLSDFRQARDRLPKSNRLLLIDQALVLLEQNYVHRPLKEAMHAVRPVQRLQAAAAADRDREGGGPARRLAVSPGADGLPVKPGQLGCVGRG
jgi:hypothetical protein